MMAGSAGGSVAAGASICKSLTSEARNTMKLVGVGMSERFRGRGEGEN